MHYTGPPIITDGVSTSLGVATVPIAAVAWYAHWIVIVAVISALAGTCMVVYSKFNKPTEWK